MFLGRFTTYFTGRNRILLPKKFRKELGSEDKFYLIMGYDGEIWGFRTEEWLKEAEKRLGIPLEDRKGRRVRREFFSQTEECLVDSQGRFILPQEFVNKALLEGEILLLGAGDHFEIWSEKVFKRAEKEI